MKKMISKLWMTVGVFLFSLCIIFQAHARTVQKDSQNVYNLDDQTFKTSLRLGLGHLTGTANEIVYRGSFSENYLSKLIWKIDEQYMAGLGFSLQKQWVAIHGDAWLGLTEGDGTMDDYDWIMEGPSWSDWSRHNDTSVTEAQIYDINCEFLIPKLSRDHFAVSVFLGYKYETFKWEARGGSYIYSVTEYRDTVGEFTPGMLGVSYEQTYKTPYLGLGFRGSYKNFEFSGRFIGSTLAVGAAKDLHHLRNLQVFGRTTDGDMYSFDISANYTFLKHFTLEFSYNYTSYDTMKGNSTYSEVVDSEISSIEYVDAKGMDLETSMISLSLIYSF